MKKRKTSSDGKQDTIGRRTLVEKNVKLEVQTAQNQQIVTSSLFTFTEYIR